MSESDRSASLPERPRVESWEHEIVALRPRLISVARRVVRDEEEARDSVDEALARFVRETRRSEVPRHPAAWLHRTVLRIAIDRARSWVRRQRELENISRKRRASPPGPQERALRAERREAVWRGVLALPERQREVVVLHEMEGLPYAEVAELLDMRETTARAHAHAARETLRRKLACWRKDDH